MGGGGGGRGVGVLITFPSGVLVQTGSSWVQIQVPAATKYTSPLCRTNS